MNVNELKAQATALIAQWKACRTDVMLRRLDAYRQNGACLITGHLPSINANISCAERQSVNRSLGLDLSLSARIRVTDVRIWYIA